MEETATNSDEAADAVAAYLAASVTSLRSLQAVSDAWRRHFEENAEAPSAGWIAQVAADQMAVDLALGRARAAIAAAIWVEGPEQGLSMGQNVQMGTKSRRRRRRESKVLATLGTPGTRMLRAVLLVLFGLALLVATGAGISLVLEVAGFLRLIDDPVQLPVGIQLLIFLASIAAAYGLKRALKPVERALYGSKGVRPKGFQL